jgi:hypothetical protein
LGKEEELPWPAQLRGLEALGALRQARLPTNAGNPEFALVAMRYLADQDARPEVRAWAAWAIGMMKVDNAISKFNFPLVAYNIGSLAAELGERIHDSHDLNPTLAEHWAGVLLYQVYPALVGVDGARDSGLLHSPGNTQARTMLRQLDDLIKPVAKASVELIREAKGRRAEAKKKELNDSVASLKRFLEKNTPSDTHLVPGSEEFPIKGEQVAENPGGR